MKTAIACSLIFLIMYVAYHMTSDSTSYQNEGAIAYFYYFILVSHIVLSVAVVPLVLLTFSKALLSLRKLSIEYFIVDIFKLARL